MSLKKFKETYLDEVLSLLWSCWSELGVPGYSGLSMHSVIDIEATILFTCSMGRYDPRLFDEMISWLDVNGQFINIQRLKNIMGKEVFFGGCTLAAIAKIISRHTNMRKWMAIYDDYKGSGKGEELFFSRSGKPIPHFGRPDKDFIVYGLLRGKFSAREQTGPVKISGGAQLIYQLRAVFGLTARSEIIAYLLTHKSAHPALIARDTYYYQKTIQDALTDMVCSNLIFVESRGREKRYALNADEWFRFLLRRPVQVKWVNYPALFSALEQVWHKLKDEKLLGLDALLLSSELRQIMKNVLPCVQMAGFGHIISDIRNHSGEAYAEVFVADLLKLFDAITTGRLK